MLKSLISQARRGLAVKPPMFWINDPPVFSHRDGAAKDVVRAEADFGRPSADRKVSLPEAGANFKGMISKPSEFSICHVG